MYYEALELEPEPSKPEMTYGQILLMNKARKFVTMRMKKRAEIRQGKKQRKDAGKLRELLSTQML